MSASPGPASRPSLFTVTCGLDLLDEWSAHATQAQKNIVHRVIFSVADKSVFTDYVVVDDVENHMEFFVLAKSDLAVKIRIDGLDSFGILYIGPSSDAQGLDPGMGNVNFGAELALGRRRCAAGRRDVRE